MLEALTAKDKWNLMFLRHDPGPVYLWYEIVHPALPAQDRGRIRPDRAGT